MVAVSGPWPQSREAAPPSSSAAITVQVQCCAHCTITGMDHARQVLLKQALFLELSQGKVTPY